MKFQKSKFYHSKLFDTAAAGLQNNGENRK